MSKYRRINHDDGTLMGVQKQTEDGVLSVYSNSVHLHTSLSLDKDFTDKEGHKPTTKKVFEKMYNETINRLNKLK